MKLTKPFRQGVRFEAMLALVFACASGCTLWQETLMPAAYSHRTAETETPPKVEQASSPLTEVVRLQDASDLQLLFHKPKAAGVAGAWGPAITDHLQQQVFAVLVNGGKEGYHQTNIWHASNALKELGVEAKNIFILSTGVPWMNTAIGDPEQAGFLVIAKPTATNLKIVLDYVETLVTSNDVVLLYMTGHGGKEHDDQIGRLGDRWESRQPNSETNFSTIALLGSSFTALDFKSQLERLENRGHPLIVFFSDECYGGGLAQMVKETASRYIAMAITDENHTTSCQNFSPFFWKILACRKWDTQEYPTLKEAFDRAMVERSTQTAATWDAGEYFYSEGLENFSISAWF